MLPARQAYSHWASVGNWNFPPAHPLVQLPQELQAFVPTDLFHRVLRPLEVAGVVAHDGLPLLLRDRVLAQVERLGDPHPVLRLLVGRGVPVRIGRAHHELARRNQDHLQLHAAAQAKSNLLGQTFRCAARLIGFLCGCQDENADCRQGGERKSAYSSKHEKNLL